MNLKINQLFFFVLFLLIIVIKLYFLSDIPPLVDEVYSYLYFIHPGPVSAITDYREPNNHMLYSLISSFLSPLPFDRILTMRLLSFTGYLALLIFLYQFIKKEFGAIAALLALSFHGFLLSTGEFGILGRGYLFMALFGNISIVSTYMYFTKEPSKKWLYLFTFTNILGLFTIPSFLFITSGLYGYGIYKSICRQDKEIIKNYFFSILLTAFVISLLYLPVIIVSGTKALFHNPWITPWKLSFLIAILPVCLLETVDYVTGFEQASIILFLWVISVLILFKKQWAQPAFRQWIQLCFFLIIASIVVILIIRRYPPYRTFYYLSFVFYATFAISLGYYIERIKSLLLKHSITGIIIIAVIIIGTYQFQKTSREDLIYGVSRNFYQQLNTQTGLILSLHPESIFVDTKDEFLDIYLKYELLKSKTFVLDNTLVNNRNYDVLILYNKALQEKVDESKYKVIKQTPEVRIYKRIS